MSLASEQTFQIIDKLFLLLYNLWSLANSNIFWDRIFRDIDRLLTRFNTGLYFSSIGCFGLFQNVYADSFNFTNQFLRSHLFDPLIGNMLHYSFYGNVHHNRSNTKCCLSWIILFRRLLNNNRILFFHIFLVFL